MRKSYKSCGKSSSLLTSIVATHVYPLTSVPGHKLPLLLQKQKQKLKQREVCVMSVGLHSLGVQSRPTPQRLRQLTTMEKRKRNPKSAQRKTAAMKKSIFMSMRAVVGKQFVHWLTPLDEEKHKKKKKKKDTESRKRKVDESTDGGDVVDDKAAKKRKKKEKKEKKEAESLKAKKSKKEKKAKKSKTSKKDEAASGNARAARESTC